MAEHRRKKHINSKPSKRRYLIMVAGIVIGALFALDPALLPQQIRSHTATQEIYKMRDRIAMKLPPDIRPRSVKASADAKPAPAASGAGYKTKDRQKLDDLITQGTH